MKSILVEYENQQVNLFVSNNLLNRFSEFIDQNKKYFILTDENVAKLYKDKLNYPNFYFEVITPGEESKTINTVNLVISKMINIGIRKSDVLISFGGGVITDLGGFIASIYKRGIKYINIPTTLLAQVDSCLGGKTGVDFEYNGLNYKNQIGTIYHPELIIVDPTLIKTLNYEEYLSGLGEIIKYGFCFDLDLFNSLKSSFCIEEAIYKCLQIKAKVTKDDEYDKGFRNSLNYGHTYAHALESYFNYNVAHGIAVMYGMIYETKELNLKNQLLDLFEKYSFPKLELPKLDLLKQYIIHDKKIIDEFISLPVVEEIGNVQVKKLKLEKYLEEYK